jgi:hypothetical protein
MKANQVDFSSVEDLRKDFQGFVTVASLRQNACQDVPVAPGVYLAIWPDCAEPEFLLRNPGGHFKGRDPTIPSFQAASRWIDRSRIIYIGKAGRSSSDANLQGRLRMYMRFGMGEPVAHWGGRLVWQLVGHENMQICWRITHAESAEAYEKQLIQEFKRQFGRRPYANLRD